MDDGQNLLHLANAKLHGLRLTALAFNRRAEELAYLEPDRYFPLCLEEVRSFCSRERFYHGFVRLTEREYDTLIFILWDRNRMAFEDDTGIVLDAYELKLREEYPAKQNTPPPFENPDEYWEWKYEQTRMEQQREKAREQRKRPAALVDNLPDDDL